MSDWFYQDKSGKQQGPVSETQIRDLIKNGVIQANSLLWREGMAQWTAASSVQEFFGLISQTPPPPAPQPIGGPGTSPTLGQINNNLVWAILTTLFCCLPFGIVAIVYASQVNSKLVIGDIAGAQDSAKKAGMWSIISASTGVVFAIVYFILVFLGVIAGIK